MEVGGLAGTHDGLAGGDLDADGSDGVKASAVFRRFRRSA